MITCLPLRRGPSWSASTATSASCRSRSSRTAAVVARVPRTSLRRPRVPHTMLSPSLVPHTMLSLAGDVPHTMLSPWRAVPQTMLSSPPSRAPHDVVAIAPPQSVPHTMLSSSPAVPQTMLSPSPRCPRRCCRRRRPCPTRCCRRRSIGAPDDVVAAARAQRCWPRGCAQTMPVPHALAVGLMLPPRQQVVTPDDVPAPGRRHRHASPTRCVGVELRERHRAERVQEAGALASGL